MRRLALALPAVLVAVVAARAGALGTLVEHVVHQKGKIFSQPTLTVKAGEPVVFKNDDAVAHNVFSGTAGHAFNLKTQAPGTESRHAFASEGTVEVRCAFHPTMKMTVTVTK